MPIKVGINAHFLTRLPRRGIGNYGLNLVREITASNPHIHFYLYIRHSDSEGALPSGKNIFIRKLLVPFDPFWEQFALPFAVYKDGVKLLHSLGNTGPIFKVGSVKHVLTIHDVMFLQTGDFVSKPATLYQKAGRLYRSFITPKCARNADAIITVSEFSKRDILSKISSLNSSQITVTYEGCDPIFSEPSQNSSLNYLRINNLGVSGPFILCLGADDPRKNTLRLVTAYLKLVQDNAIDETLVVVGYKGWERSLAYEAVLNAGAVDRVKFLPFITVDELRSLYQEALLFIYPSLYEGFGIPILEAFTVGCPVIASSVTSIPEIGSDAIFYCNPESEDDLASAMSALISNSELRRTMVEKGRIRALRFDWSEVSNKTTDVYQKCLRVIG